MENERPTKPIITVLSLEDSQRDFELIEALLSDAGYQSNMDRVETGEAFELALRQKDYDIVLADFILPEFDAFTALEKNLAICQELPFIVVSGAIGEETAIELIKKGAVDYVLKDRPRRLVSAVERALAEAEQRKAQKRAEQALEASNQLFRIAGECARFGGWHVDLTTNLVTWSDIVADIHEMPRGYTPNVDKGVAFYAPEWQEKIRRVFDDCALKGIPYHEEMEIITKKGRRVWVRTIGEPVRNEDGEIVMVQGALQDITELKVAEEGQRLRLAELEALANITEILRPVRTLDEALPILLNETLATLDFPAGCIYLFDPDSGTLKMVIASGWFKALQLIPVKPLDGITGHVYRSGKPYLTEDFVSDPLLTPDVRVQTPSNWSGAAIPIMALDMPIGVFYISCQRPKKIDSYRLQLLEALSRITGITLHRIRLLEDTETRVRRLKSQRVIDQTLIGTTDLSMALNMISAQALNRLPASAVGVLLFSTHDQSLSFASKAGFKTRAYQQSRIKLGEDYAGRAVLDNQVLYLNDLNNLKPPFLRAELLSSEGFQCYTGIPLVSKGHIKGLLEIFHKNHFAFSVEWQNDAQSLAAQIAVAIDNLQFYNHLQRSNLELTQAYDATIEGWSLALDLRDSVTEGHSLRVTEMTVALAKDMGIGDGELVHVRRGALLHDMGKLGVPDSILFKPGSLNDEEWKLMKQHPRLGYNMLSRIDYLRPALDIPYYHHEKWDGTGYPSGLKGRQIPLAARVFAVNDVYDALISNRPYRDAWPKDNALDYICLQSDAHFDPEVVEVFMQNTKKSYGSVSSHTGPG